MKYLSCLSPKRSKSPAAIFKCLKARVISILNISVEGSTFLTALNMLSKEGYLNSKLHEDTCFWLFQQ